MPTLASISLIDDGKMGVAMRNENQEWSGSGAKLTYDDLLLLPEDGLRHELIDGEHFVSSAPNRKHQAIVGNLLYALRRYLDENPIGRVYVAPLDVVLSRHDVVEPDVLYVSHSHADRLLPTHVDGAPDLVVEVVSGTSRRRDQTQKKWLYEQAGVVEYWLVDPDEHSVSVFFRTGDTFELARGAKYVSGDSLVSGLFPGLVLPLSAVFAD